MTELIKYEELAVVTTYDDDKYYLPYSQLPQLEKTLNEKKFIKLDGELIKTSNIKGVKKIKEDSRYSLLTSTQKSMLTARITKFKESIGYLPPVITTQHWISRLLQNEAI